MAKTGLSEAQALTRAVCCSGVVAVRTRRKKKTHNLLLKQLFVDVQFVEPRTASDHLRALAKDREGWPMIEGVHSPASTRLSATCALELYLHRLYFGSTRALQQSAGISLWAFRVPISLRNFYLDHKISREIIPHPGAMYHRQCNVSISYLG